MSAIFRLGGVNTFCTQIPESEVNRTPNKKREHTIQEAGGNGCEPVVVRYHPGYVVDTMHYGKTAIEKPTLAQEMFKYTNPPEGYTTYYSPARQAFQWNPSQPLPRGISNKSSMYLPKAF